MGAIVDHGFEHLAPTDQMIARTRRSLLSAARAFRDKGASPPGITDPAIYFRARAGSFLHDPSRPLMTAYEEQLAQAVRWPAEPGQNGNLDGPIDEIAISGGDPVQDAR
jgi:hypothetical protein